MIFGFECVVEFDEEWVDFYFGLVCIYVYEDFDFECFIVNLWGVFLCGYLWGKCERV